MQDSDIEFTAVARLKEDLMTKYLIHKVMGVLQLLVGLPGLLS